ncbi:MAG: hypothetical protein SF182_05880 [Deltaproteobacteria bacterium]|nr:hypothetical protein [Deltaproteobacteria bacterium]
MTPTAPIVLNGIARTILMELAPQAGGGYAAQTLQLMGALAMMLAQEWDRAAARLVEENSAIEALLADAGTPLAGSAASLRVSDLQARNRALRAALIDLHARIEGTDGAAARALELRIWDELYASTERRLLAMGVPS